jgi:UDP-glucose 4-epimerase
MRKIIVTGGVGYVGSELVRQLARGKDAEIHVIDNLACGEHRLDRIASTGMTLHRIDIRDPIAVKTVVRSVRADTIFHLAAVHYIPACEAAPGEATAINVAGTVNLLDAVDNGARFVFASSAAVYAPSDSPYVESAESLGPVDIYGITKSHGEELVRYFHERRRVDAAIVRLFNVVGPGETNPHLVPAVVGQIARGEHRVQLGNLFPRRDYIDVSDAAEGFRRLGEAAAKDDGLPILSNLGTGKSYAVHEVVDQIGKAAGVSLEIVQDPARVRQNDRPLLCASTRVLESITGWLPRTSLDRSLQAAWDSRAADGFA